MDNQERFWEAAIAETVDETCPPDVTTRVLADLADEPPDPEPPAAVQTKRKVIRGVFRVVIEVAAAAGVMFAIAWLTGLIQLGGNESNDPEQRTEPLIYAASPDAVVVENENSLELKQGWLLVTTGSPAVHCEGSVLTDVDGRVLIHAGSMPSREQFESVHPWLNANNLETDMLTNPKRWVTTMTLAALVLTGNAMLDGQRIEAQDEEQQTSAYWNTVRTVMEIDQLSEDIKFVRGERVSGAHLEFLAEHSQIEGIDFSRCENLRAEHVSILVRMKNLRFLDLRGAMWDGDPDYRAFSALTQLEELAVDYLPQAMEYEEIWPPPGWDESFRVNESLSSLGKDGVRITLGNLSEINSEQLRDIAENIPTIRELNLYSNYSVNDADMKALAEHPTLESLDITECESISELGLAYFARNNRLKRLTTTVEMNEPNLYQISRLTKLEVLSLPYGLQSTYYEEDEYEGLRTKVFEAVSKLKNLRRFDWYENESVDPKAFATLKTLPYLDTLGFMSTYYYDGSDWDELLMILQTPQQLPVRKLVLCASDGILTDPASSVSEEGLKDVKGVESLNELELQFTGSNFDVAEGETPVLPSILKRFSNLSRVVLLINYTDELSDARKYAAKWLADYDVEIQVVEEWQ